MMFPSVSPLLAADPATIIGLIVGALTLLGWIMNYANQKQAQQPPVHRPPRPRPQRAGDDRLQSEIDVFLEEVRGGRRKLGEEPARPVEAPRPAQRPERRAPRPIEQRHLEPKVAPRVEPTVAKRKRPAAAEDRPRIRQRITEQISADRIEAHASHVGRGVDAAVQSHLGLFTATDAPAPAPGSAAASAAPAATSLAQRVRAMLREPEGVRQAVLISEILARPRPGRRRP